MLAQDGDVVIGFVTVGLPDHAGANAIGKSELHAIYVDDPYVRCGIGRHLMMAAEAAMGALGVTTSLLWVLDRNAVARRFYESEGWSWDGKSRPHTVGESALTVLRYIKRLGAAEHSPAAPTEKAQLQVPGSDLNLPTKQAPT